MATSKKIPAKKKPAATKSAPAKKPVPKPAPAKSTSAKPAHAKAPAAPAKPVAKPLTKPVAKVPMTAADIKRKLLERKPAGALAQLTVGTLGERPLASLENIPHPPVSSLFLGYRRDQVAHPLDGFGGLVPAVEHRNVLGILFSSTLFPGRAPAGHVALTVFVGGMRQPDHARLSPEALLGLIDRDLQDLVGAKGPPVFLRHTHWPRAIPQYVPGFERWLDQMTALELRHPNLFLGGNARDGISVPDCIKSGNRLAGRILGETPKA
jgi:hypothetical protein